MLLALNPRGKREVLMRSWSSVVVFLGQEVGQEVEMVP